MDFLDLVVVGTAGSVNIAKSLQHAGIIRQSGNGNSILTASLAFGNDDSADDHRSYRELQSVRCHHSIMKVHLRWVQHTKEVYFRAVLPAAKSGILAGVVLGIGRAIGETMAVIMVAGNQPRLTGSIFEGVRTLTANIVIEMGYAADLHREALIATGVVLFVFILIINCSV